MKLLHSLLALSAAFALSAGAREEEKAAPTSKEEFLQIVNAHFTAWDADGDGKLSAREIDTLVANPDIRAAEAAAVAALKRASRFKVKLPEFTLEAVAVLAGQGKEKDKPHLAAMFAGGVKRIAAARRELFASGAPRLETVHQGHMGNCFSLAPLGALARCRPEYVRDQMIRPRLDGRFDVKLGAKIVTVAAPTDAELAMTSTTESDGIWVNVYEKAAGEARNAEKPADRRAATGLDALSMGGSAGTQLAFITGHEMFRLSCKFAKDPQLAKADYEAKLKEIRQALIAATQEKRLMTCGTLGTKIPGITPNHAYAVLSYDSGRDTIQLWNPHGDTTLIKGEAGVENGYPLTDGVFEVPLTVFVKEFSGLAFEVLPPSTVTIQSP